MLLYALIALLLVFILFWIPLVIDVSLLYCNPQKKTLESYIKPDSKTRWFFVGGSVIGKHHVLDNTPCQDNHYIENEGDWGFAIVCDGSSRASLSNLSSFQLSTVILPPIIKNQIKSRDLIHNFPSSQQWQKIGETIYQKAKKKLEEFSQKNNYTWDELATTLIILVYLPEGLLSLHVGDGRGGYETLNSEWKSFTKPFKGEEYNQTLFFTSPQVGIIPDSILCNAIPEKVKSIVLVSDGCEKYAFNCSVFDIEKQIWNDPNVPHPQFFSPIIEQLKKVYTEFPREVIQQKWVSFLENHKGFSEESDDKTMILGVLMEK